MFDLKYSKKNKKNKKFGIDIILDNYLVYFGFGLF